MQLTDITTIATLIGIAVTLAGIVLTSNRRLAAAFKEQNTENGKQFKYMSERFDKVDERFDTMNRDTNQRFDTMSARFDDVNARFDGVNARIDALRGDINRDVNERFDTMNRDVNLRFDTLNRATPPQGEGSPTDRQQQQTIG